MPKLITKVQTESGGLVIDHKRPILLLGSCFADEVGARLSAAGFEVLCNPFGTLYNPASIAACLHRAISDEAVGDDCMVFNEGLWHSWLHHGRFSHPDKSVALRDANYAIHQAHIFLQRKPLIIVTFGTAWVYRLAHEGSPMLGQVVANCHKLPAAWFVRSMMNQNEIVDMWQPLLEDLATEVLFTVSPIRHMADGAHGNQLSKAVLLLAVEQLLASGRWYFPSYEIALDELRDYRFYARDLCHLSDVAVDIIWERFQSTYMSSETQQHCRRCEAQWRQSQHRPLH